MYKLIPLAILPGLVLGAYVYVKDKKEKEPIKLLVKLFFSGVFSCFLAVILTYMLGFIIDIYSVNYNDVISVFVHTFIVVGFTEEFSKWLFLYFISKNSEEYNYSFDIIVYSVFVSLGFATYENIFYILDFGLDAALIRAFTTIPAHMFFAIFMGYFLLIAKKMEKKNILFKKNLNIILSIIVPVLLHGFFDFCVMYDNDIFIFIFVIFLGLLYMISYLFLEKLSDSDRKIN